MAAFLTRRLLLAIPVLFGLSTLLFLFTHALPGDTAQAILGERATPESLERLRAALGLDRPILDQYADYLDDLLHLNLGTSAVTRRPVMEDFLQRFPATVELAAAAMALAVGVGIPLGRFAARHAGGRADLAASLGSIAGISVPVFVLGLTLQYVFSVQLHLLPTIGRISAEHSVHSVTNLLLIDTLIAGRLDSFGDALAHLVLPALTLGSIPLAVVSRITRASVIEVLNEDYVRTARAKGLSERRIDRRHVLRNAWPPIITVIGLQAGGLLAGAVITEGIFGWGGVGSWIVGAIRAKDYITIQSGILIIAVLFVLINLVVDVLYVAANPRLRRS